LNAAAAEVPVLRSGNIRNHEFAINVATTLVTVTAPRPVPEPLALPPPDRPSPTKVPVYLATHSLRC
jgi:hypothetical protein